MTSVKPHGAEITIEHVTRLAAAMRVLGEPTRLSIYLLLREGEACVCELAATLDLAENLVSHHLGVLRRAELARDRRDPSDTRWVYYRLDLKTLAHLAGDVGGLFDPLTVGRRIPTCGPAAQSMPQQITRAASRGAPTAR